MTFALKLATAGLLLSLTACSASITSSGDGLSGGSADGRVLKESSDPLSGIVDQKSWRAQKAIARFEQGEYSVTIAGADAVLTCGNFFPMAPHVAFVVPNGPGRYPYDGSGGGRLVNFIFPYTTPNGGGSDNVLASKSLIVVDELKDGVMRGKVSALSPTSTDHSYELAGKFEAQICNGPAGPLSVTAKGAAGFDVAYVEAVPLSTSTYELRFMNKIPSRKCEKWSAWMMNEVPIKYVTLRAPAKVGAITVAPEVVEYGSQANSGGWSTAYFLGSAEVTSLSNSKIGYSLNVKSQASDEIVVIGQGTAEICP